MCGGGSWSASPAQGFRLHDADHPGRVRFESDGERDEFRIACVDGRPVLVEERLDD